MAAVKQEAQEMIQNLPDDCTYEDIYNVPICQDHLTQHSYFTHYATSSNS